MTNPFRAEFPFYLPCSVLMLDDDPDFLDAMRGALAREHAVLCYTSAERALTRLQQADKLAIETFLPFCGPAEISSIETGDQLLVFRAAVLDDIAVAPKRYDIISVVIVDEVMPELTGLEFCRKLQDTNVRTILLTGKVTDPQNTIDAFNDGIIDRFISKGDVDALSKISAAINELHGRYFSEKSAVLHKLTLATRKDGLSNDQLISVIDGAFEVFPFCEYYFHSDSGGFLLRNAKGDTKICLFANPQNLSEVASCLEDQNPGSEDAKRLRNGTHLLPWAFIDEESMFSGSANDQLSFEAHTLNDVLWCLIEEDEMPPGFERANSRKNTSWKDFRETLSTSDLNFEKAV